MKKMFEKSLKINLKKISFKNNSNPIKPEPKENFNYEDANLKFLKMMNIDF